MITALPSLTSRCHMPLFLLLPLVLSGCARTERSLVEPQPAYQPSPQQETASQLNLPRISAKQAEVHDAVKRIFKEAAVLDATATPQFIVGDFNGDASQDLAVVLKPAAGKLDAINELYPAWLLRDPFAQAAGSDSLRVAENESLLAVIHGYGANDWRDPQATQTFLLKNSVGRNLESTSMVDFVKSNSGRKIPRLRGDVISEVVRGNQGCLYFTRASYQWYDPTTFRGESNVPATVHGRMGQTAR